MSTVILPILTREEKDGNIAISNGKLTIVVMTENLNDVCRHIRDEAVAWKQDNESKVDPDVWQDEAKRLSELAERIVSPECDFNIFDFIDLTKSGNFPKNKNQLIATSKCLVSGTYDYPVARRLQLKLVPAYGDLWEWMEDIRLDDTMILKLDVFDSVRKQEPVFDEDGIPHKVVVTKASYLRDDQIVPGRIYEEKSGTQFLCITGCAFKIFCVDNPTGKRDYLTKRPFASEKDHHGDPWYCYVRWTAALAKEVGSDTSYANILRALADKDNVDTAVFNRISSRITPRKFVREISTLFDPASIQPETIIGRAFKNCRNVDKRWEYEILGHGDR